MKKILLLLCSLFYYQLSFGQAISNSLSVAFESPNLLATYGPNDQMTIPILLFGNNTQDDVNLNVTFTLLSTSSMEEVYTSDLQTLTYGIGNTSETSLTFDFPDACLIPDGTYDLELRVYFSNGGGTAPVTTSTFLDLNELDQCENLLIPVTAPYESSACTVKLGNSPLASFEFENGVSCCTYDPEINIEVTPNDLTWPPKFLRCEFYVEAQVLFEGDEAVAYDLLWSHGNVSPSFTHPCDVTTYTLTVSWEELGQTCSKTSEPITVVSHCACEIAVPAPSPPSGPPPMTATDEDINATSGNRFVQIVPNPNPGHFRLQFSDEKEVLGIEVWNMMGQKVWQQTGSFYNDYPIDLPNLSKGIYILTVQYPKQEQKVQRFELQ